MMLWLLVAVGVVILIPFFRLLFYMLVGGVMAIGLVLVDMWETLREMWE